MADMKIARLQAKKTKIGAQLLTVRIRAIRPCRGISKLRLFGRLASEDVIGREM